MTTSPKSKKLTLESLQNDLIKHLIRCQSKIIKVEKLEKRILELENWKNTAEKLFIEQTCCLDRILGILEKQIILNEMMQKQIRLK